MSLPGERPGVDQVRAWLAEVEDPEIPVISIVDLGIVRDVAWQGDECVVTLTPTYSGCPATEVIARSVLDKLRQRGIAQARFQTRLAPPWTTDWLSEEGARKLKDYGIAPPGARASQPAQVVRVVPPKPPCPRCGSRRVALTSAFGSTPCKSMYRCEDCLEPFDHFKPH
jgi:ring-1,2-phenylacetyl-CoA epoxidase subunit PaaD